MHTVSRFSNFIEPRAPHEAETLSKGIIQPYKVLNPKPETVRLPNDVIFRNVAAKAQHYCVEHLSHFIATGSSDPKPSTLDPNSSD